MTTTSTIASSTNTSAAATGSEANDELLVAVALYGMRDLLVLRLSARKYSKHGGSSEERPPPAYDLFSDDVALDGLHREVALSK